MTLILAFLGIVFYSQIPFSDMRIPVFSIMKFRFDPNIQTQFPLHSCEAIGALSVPTSSTSSQGRRQLPGSGGVETSSSLPLPLFPLSFVARGGLFECS